MMKDTETKLSMIDSKVGIPIGKVKVIPLFKIKAQSMTKVRKVSFAKFKTEFLRKKICKIDQLISLYFHLFLSMRINLNHFRFIVSVSHVSF
jgi:hypothetical protein